MDQLTEQRLQMLQTIVQTPPWEVEYTRDVYIGWNIGPEFLIRSQKYPDARIWLYFDKDRSVEVKPGWECYRGSMVYAHIRASGQQMTLRTYEGLELAAKLPQYLQGLIPLFEEVPHMEDLSRSPFPVCRVGKHFTLLEPTGDNVTDY